MNVSVPIKWKSITESNCVCVFVSKAMVSCQMLSELEEVIQYKLVPERRDIIRETWWERLQVLNAQKNTHTHTQLKGVQIFIHVCSSSMRCEADAVANGKHPVCRHVETQQCFRLIYCCSQCFFSDVLPDIVSINMKTVLEKPWILASAIGVPTRQSATFKMFCGISLIQSLVSLWFMTVINIKIENHIQLHITTFSCMSTHWQNRFTTRCRTRKTTWTFSRFSS